MCEPHLKYQTNTQVRIIKMLEDLKKQKKKKEKIHSYLKEMVKFAQRAEYIQTTSDGVCKAVAKINLTFELQISDIINKII